MARGVALAAVAWSDISAAALPPKYERLRELEAVLGNDEVIQKLGDEVIEGIEATNGNRVWTARCAVVVTLVSAPNAPPIAGP